MKFFGHGIVWDAENNRPLCRFADGKLGTDDQRIISVLIGLGYRFDGEPPEHELTRKEIMQQLDGLGIQYSARAHRDELLALLGGEGE